jgi:hypothetical protein
VTCHSMTTSPSSQTAATGSRITPQRAKETGESYTGLRDVYRKWLRLE